MWVMRTAESVVLTPWPPWTAGAVDVDANVLFLDLDVDAVVDLGDARRATRTRSGACPRS